MVAGRLRHPRFAARQPSAHRGGDRLGVLRPVGEVNPERGASPPTSGRPARTEPAGPPRKIGLDFLRSLADIAISRAAGAENLTFPHRGAHSLSNAGIAASRTARRPLLESVSSIAASCYSARRNCERRTDLRGCSADARRGIIPPRMAAHALPGTILR